MGDDQIARMSLQIEWKGRKRCFVGPTFFFLKWIRNIFSLFLCDLWILQHGPLEGALFADYGTDLGSGPTVPGRFYFFGKLCFVVLLFLSLVVLWTFIKDDEISSQWDNFNEKL